jgi:uncharacterized protein
MRYLILVALMFSISFASYSQKKKHKIEQKVQASDSTAASADSTGPAGSFKEKAKKGKSKKKSSFASKVGKAQQQPWDSIPDPVGLTSDFEKVFTDEQVEHLDSLIIDYEKKTSIEIAIITVDSACINGDFFTDLPVEVAKKWAIGKEKKMNGIVMAVSVSYRKISFFLDTGIQQYMSDEEAKEIIKKKMFPMFKIGKNYDGVLAGLTSLMALIDSRRVEMDGK